MMRAFVINLDADAGRLAHMSDVLGTANIPFERFPAIEAERVRQHPAFDQVPTMRARPWLDSELGCLLSHYEVWRQIADGADSHAMVFEDDVFVDPRLEHVFTGACQLPPHAHLVKVEIGVTGPLLLSRRPARQENGIAFHRLLSEHNGSGAYVISKEGAAFLTRSVAAFDLPVDSMLFTPHHRIGHVMRAFQTIPALAIQSVNYPEAGYPARLASHIMEERHNATKYMAAVLEVNRVRKQGLAPPRPLPVKKARRRPRFTLRRLWWQLRARIATRWTLVTFGPGARR